MQTHLHSVAFRYFGVLSPAPPPSARIASGLSGTARTLRKETRWRCPVARGANPPECPPAFAIPCSTCRWLMAPHQQVVGRYQDLRHPWRVLGPVPLCIRLQGNGPQPDATASKGRDVTARVRKAGTLYQPLTGSYLPGVVRVPLGRPTVNRHGPPHTVPEWLV